MIYSSTTVGSHAKYFCNDGYYLVGIRFRKCEETGWTDKAPICKRKAVQLFINFPVFCTDKGLNLDQIKSYNCTRMIIHCHTLIHVAILCDRLPSLKYGRIRLSYGYRWHSVATHTCDWGYQFKKDHSDIKRVCQEDGSWSGSPPLCIRKSLY